MTPTRARLYAVTIPIALLVGAGWIGGALAPTLLVKAPLALVALNPALWHVVLVAPRVDPVLLVVVAVARMFAPDPFCYALGRMVGPVAIDWLVARWPVSEGPVRFVQRIFGRWAIPLLLLSPGLTLCTLAGVTGMRASLFVTINLIGTIAQVVLLWWFAGTIAGPIGEVLRFVDENVVPLTVGTAFAAMLGLEVWRRKRAKGASVQAR